jgi:DNA-binding MarR family transcriptional regulator
MASGRAGELGQIADNLQMFLPMAYKKLMRVGRTPRSRRASYLEAPVLGMLERSPPLPTSEIGRRLCISKPNMTPLINKLIAEGKAKRHQGEEDKRLQLVTITPKGRKYMKEHAGAVKSDIKRNLSSLGREDLRRLCVSLDTIRIIVTKMDEVEHNG